MYETFTQMFSIGAFFRWVVSPKCASEMQCFISSICANGEIFVTVDWNTVIIILYH